MKTIKQIRESYESKFLDHIPKEISLDESDKSSRSLAKSSVPSPREMPVVIMFRRISYRMYPNNQVVALYYSKQLDKYLSIPFGPTGNLNLSKGGLNLSEDIDEGVGGDDKEKEKEKPQTQVHNVTQVVKQKPEMPHVKTSSSWDKRSSLSMKDINVMKKQAQIEKGLKENKISDIRRMINEGVDNMTLPINGKQITLNTSVNIKNKKIVEGMLNEDLESFKKLLNFSIRN